MKCKKVISVFLAVVMLVACMPAMFAGAKSVEEETEMNVELAATLPYKDTSLTFEERAADLVSRMTLAEKVSQIVANSASEISRLGVSSYNYWKEGLHGVARQGSATCFPTSLSMSNTWDRDLIFRIGDITSTEARGKNNKTNLSYWSPTINMARDPRWGRNEESYGEDPFLTSEIGTEFVDGMQGTDATYLKTIATLKHFAANNNEGERQTGSSEMTEKTLREYYTRAFKDITQNADAASVMSSYNALTVTRNGETILDYIPSTANEFLLTDLLRRTWGFNGYVVGDCGAWANLSGRSQMRQKLFPDLALGDINSAMVYAKGIEAGADLDCGGAIRGGEGDGGLYDSVDQGYLDENELDLAVYRMFLQRMRTGEFGGTGTNPYASISSSVIEKQEHVDVALEAAEKSWVLLENNNDTLPINTATTNNIAVVGNLASELEVGDYSPDSSKKEVNPIKGLEEKYGAEKINYLGKVEDTTPLFNIKSITFELSDGKIRTVDLSTTTNVGGMTKTGSTLTDVTGAGVAVIPNVNFADVVKVKVEASSVSASTPSSTLNIGYGSHTQSVSTVQIATTENSNTYAINTGNYLEGGGYYDTVNLYLSVKASSAFSVENYRTQLDAADVIIAYAGTTEADSGESNDRASIALPNTQGHVAEICENYPEKTVVVLSTVGQVDVAGFKNKCAAMLWTSYNGQLQGTALANVLSGAANPGGKLTTTWYTVDDLNKMPNGSPGETIDGIKYNVSDYEIKQKDGYPGRTYQYHAGTPVYPFGYGISYSDFEYSNIKVDKANASTTDTVKVSVDVKNTSSVKGAEVVQLYVSVPGADGKTLPLKQLKNFERVEIGAGETKTVTLDLDVAEVYFYDESTQSNYIVEGAYTVNVGPNADEIAVSTTVNVSGTIEKVIKTVKAVPSGIIMYGGKSAGDTTSTPAHGVDPNLSIVLTDDSFIDLSQATITYTSSDESVAKVVDGVAYTSDNEGAALITANVTYNGKTISESFPVVSQFKEKNDDASTEEHLNKLKNAYNAYPEIAYTNESWTAIQAIYNTAVSDITNTVLKGDLPAILEKALADLAVVPRIELTDSYSIKSENPYMIEDDIIDYTPSGIGVYTSTATTISGTITADAPKQIQLEAYDENGQKVDTGNVLWTIEKLDGSGRKSATIDTLTGVLTIYENGIFRLSANDYGNLKYGSMIVQANLQIEGESSDNAGTAKITDVKTGASGSSETGNNVGSTGTNWMRFDGVKLENLSHVTFRVSKDSGDSALNIALSANTSRIIATGTAPETGAWTNWEEVTIPVDQDAVKNLASLDENGCTSIYVQTNSANFDFMKLIYQNTSLDISNKAGGSIHVNVPFESGTLIVAKYNNLGILVDSKIQEITAPDEYVFDGYEENDNVSFFMWDGIDTLKPIEKAVTHTYNAPKATNIIWRFDDPEFADFYTASAEQNLVSGTGLDGYGGWGTDTKSVTYKFNGTTHTITKGLKGGSGNKSSRCVYFTPSESGIATIVFSSPDVTRNVAIEQGGKVLVRKEAGVINTLVEVQAYVEAGVPVYMYGGGSNKTIYAVTFSSDGEIPVTTATAEPTASPSPEPSLPPIDYSPKVEFENYVYGWHSGATKTSNTDASGGVVLDNTRQDDYFYLGEYDLTGLAVIDVVAGTKEATAQMDFYAVDISGVTISESTSKDTIKGMLTSANKIGTTYLKADPKSWNAFKSNNIFVSPRTGTYGLFARTETGGAKYCGNFDSFTMMYSFSDAEVAGKESETVSASSKNIEIVAKGSELSITTNSGTTKVDYNEARNTNVSFKDLVWWSNQFIGLIEDDVTGKTDLVAGYNGIDWSIYTPTSFAQSDLDLKNGIDLTINDIINIDNQLYLACNDGILITMTACSKCYILRQVCDFDISTISVLDDKVILDGENNTKEIEYKSLRQNSIKIDAAKELESNGATIVDLRDAKDFAKSSYENSINVPLDSFEKWLSNQPTDSVIILVCYSGMRSATAIDMAVELGYTSVYNLGNFKELL